MATYLTSRIEAQDIKRPQGLQQGPLWIGCHLDKFSQHIKERPHDASRLKGCQGGEKLLARPKMYGPCSSRMFRPNAFLDHVGGTTGAGI